jgi:hypothetical protein
VPSAPQATTLPACVPAPSPAGGKNQASSPQCPTPGSTPSGLTHSTGSPPPTPLPNPLPASCFLTSPDFSEPAKADSRWGCSYACSASVLFRPRICRFAPSGLAKCAFSPAFSITSTNQDQLPLAASAISSSGRQAFKIVPHLFVIVIHPPRRASAPLAIYSKKYRTFSMFVTANNRCLCFQVFSVHSDQNAVSTGTQYVFTGFGIIFSTTF